MERPPLIKIGLETHYKHTKSNHMNSSIVPLYITEASGRTV